MRQTFINTMIELARTNPKLMLLIGDTGFSVVEPFEQEFGPRFMNIGIAEQNFISVAAGIAAMGMKPVAYNVVSFMTLRAAEQIFLDICYQENPVVMVGVGGGFAYGNAGPTHHSLQDIAIMRSFPNLLVYCPGDPVEMRWALCDALESNHPAYIRIGRSVDPVVHQSEVLFQRGRAVQVYEGTDVTLFVCGTMLKEAVQVQKMLEQDGISTGLYSMPSIKPLDCDTIQRCAQHSRLICTIEEHSVVGGLGSAVAEVLSDDPKGNAPLKRFGVPDSFAMLTGGRDFQLNYFGLAPEQMYREIKQRLG